LPAGEPAGIPLAAGDSLRPRPALRPEEAIELICREFESPGVTQKIRVSTTPIPALQAARIRTVNLFPGARN